MVGIFILRHRWPKAPKKRRKSLLSNQEMELCSGEPPVQERRRWKLPPEGVVKTNWDDALDISNKRMGVGVVVRDASGAILASMVTTIPFIRDPTVAEAMAAWKAVVFCSELGFQRVIFEGDALEIVNALRQESPR